MSDFNLKSLVEYLQSKGEKVIRAEPDDQPYLAEFRERLLLPPPLFFVVVDCGDELVLNAGSRIMDLVWSKFRRGSMEFRASREGETTTVKITQKRSSKM